MPLGGLPAGPVSSPASTGAKGQRAHGVDPSWSRAELHDSKYTNSPNVGALHLRPPFLTRGESPRFLRGERGGEVGGLGESGGRGPSSASIAIKVPGRGPLTVDGALWPNVGDEPGRCSNVIASMPGERPP